MAERYEAYLTVRILLGCPLGPPAWELTDDDKVFLKVNRIAAD
jgi:hypothetical protein